MTLAIADRNYIKLEVSGLTLQAFTVGDVHCYSLEGITELACSYNHLTELPEFPDTITVLMCFYNELETLPKLSKRLREFGCSNNRLAKLPELPKSLRELVCSDNRLEYLPELPNKLTSLLCYGNKLKSLPCLPKTLKSLYCFDNQLQSLPILPGFLSVLECYNNPLLFIPPATNRPARCHVPPNLASIFSRENYSTYQKRYQTYFYLISYLTIKSGLIPSILANKAWWFPGSL